MVSSVWGFETKMAVEEPIRCIYTPNVAAELGGAHARNAEIAISCRRRFIIQRNRWYAARISLYYLHLCPYDATAHVRDPTKTINWEKKKIYRRSVNFTNAW